MKILRYLIESQRRPWVLIQYAFGLSDEKGGSRPALTFLRRTLLAVRQGDRTQSEGEEHREEGDRPTAAASVTADARREEISSLGAQLHAVSDQEFEPTWPPAERSLYVALLKESAGVGE